MPRADNDDSFEMSPEDLALASLDLAQPGLTPPAGLWARIAGDLEAPRAQGVAVERFAEGRWKTLAPGVRFKRLWDKNTLLIECEPGASIPDHRHKTVEHAVVLRGDLVSDRTTYLAGDYHGTQAGGVHDVWTTTGGCLVMVQYAA